MTSELDSKEEAAEPRRARLREDGNSRMFVGVVCHRHAQTPTDRNVIAWNAPYTDLDCRYLNRAEDRQRCRFPSIDELSARRTLRDGRSALPHRSA